MLQTITDRLFLLEHRIQPRRTAIDPFDPPGRVEQHLYQRAVDVRDGSDPPFTCWDEFLDFPDTRGKDKGQMITVIFSSDRLILVQLHHRSFGILIQVFLDETPGIDVDVLPDVLAGHVNRVDQFVVDVLGVTVVEEY